MSEHRTETSGDLSGRYYWWCNTCGAGSEPRYPSKQQAQEAAAAHKRNAERP